MNTQNEIAYCTMCKSKVTYHFRPVNHWMQLVLCLFTLGLWGPIWLCLTLYRTKVCDKCENAID